MVCKSHTYNFIKKESPTQMFRRGFCEIYKSTSFTEHFSATASVLQISGAKTFEYLILLGHCNVILTRQKALSLSFLGVVNNITKFTGKYLRRSFFFNKVSDLTPATSDTGVFL